MISELPKEVNRLNMQKRATAMKMSKHQARIVKRTGAAIYYTHFTHTQTHRERQSEV